MRVIADQIHSLELQGSKPLLLLKCSLRKEEEGLGVTFRQRRTFPSRLHLQSQWSLRISGNSTKPKVGMHFLLVRKHQPPYSLLLASSVEQYSPLWFGIAC
jgi:hypothetical protein